MAQMLEEIEDVLFVGKEVALVRMFLKTANWSEAPEAFSLVRDELTHQLQKAAEESSRTSP